VVRHYIKVTQKLFNFESSFAHEINKWISFKVIFPCLIVIARHPMFVFNLFKSVFNTSCTINTTSKHSWTLIKTPSFSCWYFYVSISIAAFRNSIIKTLLFFYWFINYILELFVELLCYSLFLFLGLNTTRNVRKNSHSQNMELPTHTAVEESIKKNSENWV